MEAACTLAELIIRGSVQKVKRCKQTMKDVRALEEDGLPRHNKQYDSETILNSVQIPGAPRHAGMLISY